MDATREEIQDSLDAVISTRSSITKRTAALRRLEQLLANVLQSKEEVELESFLALQYTFECNIPSRLLSWISTASVRIDQLASRPSDENANEVAELFDQLCTALSLIQGISMKHPSTKAYLSRKGSQEVLVDLLLSSRHMAPVEPAKPQQRTTLSSIVLDTILCILVDSPAALRTFEASNGLQAVVKILKRAGTPREVRMNCLEFLYFYLLDEETPTTANPNLASPSRSPQKEYQQHRTPAKKAFLGGGPRRPPSSRYGSSSFSFSSSTSDPASKSTPLPSSASFTFVPVPPTNRSTSSSSFGSSTSSSNSMANSSTSTSTTASSIPSSPSKKQRIFPPQTPKPKALGLLQKEVEFIPMSPTKPTRLGPAFVFQPSPGRVAEDNDRENVRSTEEKKKLLGTMLGNVDALVESVRKAGIWGLG